MQMQVFNFTQRAALRVHDKNGSPWFVAQDVCHCLGIANHRNATKKLDDDEKDGVQILDAIGRLQKTTIVSESGMYAIILRSDGAMTPGTQVHAFRKWVTHKVLPAIRKTGVYIDESHPNVRAAAQSDLGSQPQPHATAPDFTGATAIPELVLLRQLYATQARLIELMEVQLKPKPRRAPNRPLTEEEIKMARDMKSRGVTQSAIAKHLGRSDATISFICRELH